MIHTKKIKKYNKSTKAQGFIPSINPPRITTKIVELVDTPSSINSISSKDF